MSPFLLPLLFAVLPPTNTASAQNQPTTVQKIDCFPESSLPTRQECEQRHCVYDSSHPPGFPACYYDLQNQGYSMRSKEDTSKGFLVHLQSNTAGPFHRTIDKAVMEVQMLSDDVLRITFDDEVDKNRYKLPVHLSLPEEPLPSNPKYRVVITGQGRFSFKVLRTDTNTTIWDTGVGGLVLSDQFLQLATRLPSDRLYGLGENLHDTFKHNMNASWPAFARDQPPSFSKGENLYGVHPFYTCLEDTQGNTHGVLLLNSNAQDFTLSPLPMLTYRTIGGILDFYFFFGPTPEQVIQQYTLAIGLPMMPPYWGLGFQQSRYGYNHVGEIKKAVETTRKYGIPLDVQVADIDYMDERKDFTVDMVNFGDLNDYFKQLQASGMRTIVILDPCLVSNYTDYEPYQLMKAVDGFVKWPSDVAPPAGSADSNGALLGYVWPKGKTACPDFLKNQTRSVWKDLIVTLRNNVTFDGLWIDMNEPASFGTNEERPFNWPESVKPYWSLKCPHNDWEDPPYRSKAAYLHDSPGKPARLSDKTICMSAVQGDSGQFRHYDVHSLYGYSETVITQEAARAATGERSVVITRSTFPGSGKHGGHWLGDNQSKWSDLRHSVIGILEFNLFGIPYIGADICGFFGDTTPELCKRWMQLGAFYTFCRNHNAINQKPQEPGFLGEEVARASREILETRYWLLPFLYTLFHQAHTQGGTVIRPLHHEFPADTATYDIDRQFLWGPALLISPILEEDQTAMTFYVPDGQWYDFFSGHVVIGPRFVTIAVTSESKPVLLVRGGYILPLQKPGANTAQSRKNPLKLLVALDNNGTASGSLFWDDGVSIDTFENGNYYFAEFKATPDSLSFKVTHNNVAETSTLTFSDLDIWGVEAHVHDVTIRGDSGPVDWTFDWDYDSSTKIFKISNIAAPLSSNFTVSWKTVEESAVTRIDCWPERQGGVDVPDINKCQLRGCVYQPHKDPAIPDCFFPQSNYGYSVDGPWETTPKGLKVNLRRVGTGPFGNELSHIVFTMEEYGDNVMRFKFDTPSEDRYTVPMQLNLPQDDVTSSQYRFEVISNDTFAFRVVRVATGAVLFDTGVGGLVFHDQFLQLSSRLATRNVYGMGENIHSTFRRDLWYHTYAFFARDQPTRADDTLTHYRNHYGTHPFYQCVEEDGNAHGVLLFNSNPQDYTFTPLPMITYRTIGGILDFYLFLGPSPENVVQQYTAAVGRPYMPPYWALGFQLCKYGYNSLDNMKTAVDRTKAAGIPHDVQYVDIDHMSERRDFTLDNDSFRGLPEYFESLRDQGMRTIIILDPAVVSNYSDYEPYKELKAVSGFIKWPNDTGYTYPKDSADDDGSIFGYVWPRGKTVFPDFFKSETRRVWRELIVKHRGRIAFDGLWTDMNEPAVFGTNEDRPFNWPADVKPYWSLKCPVSKLDDPPYRTGASFNFDEQQRRGRLSDKTLCLTGVQGEHGEYRHYDVHNLYGWSQTPPTLEALRSATGERGVVVTRSTFVGSGQYAGHWLGDNLSSWGDLRASIVGILEFNLFGFAYTGADICGHFGTATAELCKRWMQLGAFYTFSRNHNAVGNRDQDPGNFGEEVSRVAREAMETRYWLLPHLYTLFHQVNTNGGTVIRPLHHEFPTDPKALGNSRQFLWGAHLLISPVLYPNVTSLTYYVPSAKWYDFYTGKEVTSKGGFDRTVAVKPESKIELLVRGGVIMPLQDSAQNTTFSRKNPFTLFVALDNNNAATKASGQLFWDDGVSVDTFQSGDYYLANFSATESTLTVSVIQNNVAEIQTLYYGDIYILGVPSRVVSITVDDFTSGTAKQDFSPKWSYDSDFKRLVIERVGVPLSLSFTVTWGIITEEEFSRVDCWPERQGGMDVPDLNSCMRRNCVWQPHWHEKVPDCFFPTDNFGYKVDGQFFASPLGQSARLTRLGPGPFGDDWNNVLFTVEEHADDVLRFKFTTEDNSRYQVPKQMNLSNQRASDPKYKFEVTSLNPFAFQVIRKDTGAVLFDTGVGGLVLEDQFLQLSTRLCSENVYGLGENVHRTFKRDLWYDTYPIFGRDQPTIGADALKNHFNHYGTHPFYQCVEKDGNAHGVLLLNSDPQDYSFTPLPMLTYRTIGGILDFYMFLGPSPENVAEQYTGVVGRPYMPPYWALGFQLCKYGYNSLDNMKTAVDRTKAAGIPHDVQIADIDHFDQRRDFTIDNDSFSGLPEYFHQLRQEGMRTIIIIDPAVVSNYSDYEPYKELKAVSGFIKWPNDTGYTYPLDSADDDGSIFGYVWPQGKTVFPDFFKTRVREEWRKLIVRHRGRIEFDGLWIDMNEPAVFGTNEDRPFNWPADVKPYWSLKCPVSKLDDPPYRTGGAFSYDTPDRRARLSDKTLCLTVVQGEHDQYRHYDVHNMYGWSQQPPTLEGIRDAVKHRGIVISRSTFVGSGAYAGHWLGDNASGWDDLRASIIGIQEFNLFGITYTGADICGHFGTASSELCKRWMQLGAFYTFSRNHNAIGNRDQDPGNFNEEISRLSREAMETRYWLLPYLYTLMHCSHTQGNTVLRPVHHEFSDDQKALNLNEQFMWGAGLLISPIVYPNATELSYYIPKGRWYNFYDGSLVTAYGQIEKAIPVQSDTAIQLSVRGGYILPMQEPARNTTYSRKNAMSLLVALSNEDTQGGTALGSLFWDDGESIDTYEKGNYYLSEFKVENKALTMNIVHNNVPETQNLHFDQIKILGVTKMPRFINSQSGSQTPIHTGVKFDDQLQILEITLTASLNANLSLSWY